MGRSISFGTYRAKLFDKVILLPYVNHVRYIGFLEHFDIILINLGPETTRIHLDPTSMLCDLAFFLFLIHLGHVALGIFVQEFLVLTLLQL